MAEKVSIANNHLTFSLFKQLSLNRQKNDVISPLCISSGLAMVYLGAKKETAEEMRRVLGYRLGKFNNDNDVHSSFKQVLNSLYNLQQKHYKFLIANRLILPKSDSFNVQFISKLLQFYNSDIQIIPGSVGDEGLMAIKECNDWLKKITNKKIRKVFKKPLNDPYLSMILVTAIHFKGDWTEPFIHEETKECEFLNKGMSPVKVKMMHGMKRSSRYCKDETLNAQLIELRYKGDEMSMIFILPNEITGLTALKSLMSQDNLNHAIGFMKESKVDVYLPQFRLDYKYKLAKALKAIGLEKVFIEVDADLSGIDSQRVEPLYLSRVVHKVILKVKENGTKAATASTSESSQVQSVTPDDNSLIPVFKADHPFLFLMRDTRNGMILFIGQVNKLK